MLKVIVIGGTRFIGLYAVRRLLENDHEVILFNRSGTGAFGDAVKWRQGDRNHPDRLHEVLKETKPDVVLDMIPITGQQAKMLVEAAQGQTPRIVAISSNDVYQAYGIMLGLEPPDTPLQENPLSEFSSLRSCFYPYRGPALRPNDHPQKILDDYDKILVERVVMDTRAIAGTVLRLPIVFGPYDSQHRMYEFLKRMLDRRPALIIEKPFAQYSCSRGYVANIAEAIYQAVIQERAAGEIFNAADQTVWTTREWVETIADAVSWKGPILLTEPSATPDHLHLDMNCDQHLVTDTTRIRDLLGFVETVNSTESIMRTIEWEAANPPQMSADQQALMFNYTAEDALIDTLL